MSKTLEETLVELETNLRSAKTGIELYLDSDEWREAMAQGRTFTDWLIDTITQQQLDW